VLLLQFGLIDLFIIEGLPGGGDSMGGRDDWLEGASCGCVRVSVNKSMKISIKLSWVWLTMDYFGYSKGKGSVMEEGRGVKCVSYQGERRTGIRPGGEHEKK
jgi:hypothetical protein